MNFFYFTGEYGTVMFQVKFKNILGSFVKLVFRVSYLSTLPEPEKVKMREPGNAIEYLSPTSISKYRFYSNKRRGAYFIFRATSAAPIRGRRLFKNCTKQIYFFYIQFLFNGTLSFYLLIFLWTDPKLIVNLELHSKNSGKRAYRLSREIQSLCTKEHHIYKENKLPMLF